MEEARRPSKIGVRCLMDAAAIMALVRDERGADTVERLLPVAGISTVNLTEVIKLVVARKGKEAAVQVADDLASLGLLTLDYKVSVPDSAHIITLDSEGALSLGDICCLATARAMKLPVVTDDTAWPPIGAEAGVTVHLFR